jgi:hypothetical protein
MITSRRGADTSGPYWISRSAEPVPPPTTVKPREGIVRPLGRAYRDDTGIFHPKGITFFWAMQGEKHKTEKFEKHLDYLVEREHRPDEIRILAEVDWPGWGINPHEADYERILGNVLDKAYVRGLRCQITLIGGERGDALYGTVIDKVARVVNAGRRHMVGCFEIVNERHRLDKMTFANMERAGRLLRERLGPEHLIGLSCVEPRPRKAPEHDNTGQEAMIDAMQRSGANLLILHLRRTDWEYGWDHVSQGYDFQHNEGFPGRNNEPKGPQSSDGGENRPILIAMNRLTAIVCNGGAYVFHPGQMVTGNTDLNHGRPDNLWEVPNIEACMDAAFHTGIDALIPDGIENWKCVNNWRDAHPMPLPKQAFWSDEHYEHTGWINKNYAAVGPDGQWAVALNGVKTTRDGAVVAGGRLTHRSRVTVLNPLGAVVVLDEVINGGQDVPVAGLRNSEVGYLVIGKS